MVDIEQESPRPREGFAQDRGLSLFAYGGKMNVVQEREEIATRYGFSTYAELLDISIPLPAMGGDRFRNYLARGMGYWFVWEDRTQPYGELPEPESLE